MTKVKICGLTEEAHVREAVEAGANAIGFVFAPSRREISIDAAKKLAEIIPESVLKIGVFVNASHEVLRETYQTVGLDYIQLHGEETPEFIQEVGLPSIKAFSVKEKADVEKALQYDVDYYLFDAPGIAYKGGSGIPFDWALLQNTSIPKEKLILAGGLHKENVQEAIHRIQPFMVDVSSGVEVNQRKDERAIQQFMTVVRDEER